MLAKQLGYGIRWHSAHHFALHAALTGRCRDIIEERYPDCEFHVIFFDIRRDAPNQDLIARFRKLNLRLHLVSDILPQKGAEDFRNTDYTSTTAIPMRTRINALENTWQRRSYEKASSMMRSADPAFR